MVDSIYLLYAFLCGGSLYVALLCTVGRRAPGTRSGLILGYVGLAIAFAFLTAGRAQLLGVKHGEFAHWTRVAFALYGVSLLMIVGRYWLVAWRARKQ